MMLNLAKADKSTKQSESLAEAIPVWALVGPTAIGKSALAMELAEALPAEIVNCDSVQCYRGFVIGAAAPTTEEQQRVAHHLVGFADLAKKERVDAHLYVKRAREVIASLHKRRVRPLLCGGTGLYARSLRYGVADVKSDLALRRHWSQREQDEPGSVYRALSEHDPESAGRIGPHNPARLLRALEMVLVTGRCMADVWRDAPTETTPTVLVALNASREWLLPRIEKRVQKMLEQGLIGEVQSLLTQGVDADAPPMRAVGYREVLAHLDGALTQDALFPAIVQRTWQYVRRQRTWLRREQDVRWLDAESLWALPADKRRAVVLDAFRAPSTHAQEHARRSNSLLEEA